VMVELVEIEKRGLMMGVREVPLFIAPSFGLEFGSFSVMTAMRHYNTKNSISIAATVRFFSNWRQQSSSGSQGRNFSYKLGGHRHAKAPTPEFASMRKCLSISYACPNASRNLMNMI
jgi:hypothetical protein